MKKLLKKCKNAGMSSSNPLMGRTLVVLTKKYTTQATFNELEALRVFLTVRTIKKELELSNRTT